MIRKLTRNAREQLASKLLNLTAWEWHKTIALQKVKDTLPQQIGDDADVIPKVEAVAEVDALVAVLLVIRGQRRQHPQLDPRRVAILLNGADDLDGAAGLSVLVVRLHHFSECALAK
jgi:hypothetical protein